MLRMRATEEICIFEITFCAIIEACRKSVICSQFSSVDQKEWLEGYYPYYCVGLTDIAFVIVKLKMYVLQLRCDLVLPGILIHLNTVYFVYPAQFGNRVRQYIRLSSG
jgi:hypothetical protein